MDYTEILINLRRIIRAVNLEGKRIEKKYGLSIPQLLCLHFLKDQEDFRATHSAIKDYLQLNASTVTGIVDRLEKRGLVARLPVHPQDRRINYIVLTKGGQDLIAVIPELLHDQLCTRLNKAEDKKIQELRDAFRVIIGFLEIENMDAAPILTVDELTKKSDS
ncbi:MAG: MarR family winged helix-turn-helix transcriptional regulator [Bernardetiaceae bacterium]